MKFFIIKSTVFLILFALPITQLKSQIIWSEDFGSGCGPEEIANGFTTANGAWETIDINTNGPLPNQWYISAKESGMDPGSCSSSCDTDASLDKFTLHIGKNSATGEYDGATFLNGADNITSVLAKSPAIDLSGECGLILKFDYMIGGENPVPNVNDLSVLVFDDSDTTLLNTPIQSTFCEVFGAEYRSYQITLPTFVNDNPNVHLGFYWENDEDSEAFRDISFAVHNITIENIPPTDPTIVCPTDTTIYLSADCEYSLGDFTEVVTVNDLCTPVNDLDISQTIPVGTVFGIASFDLEIEVENQFSLTNQCTISIDIVDTISPVITSCPSDQEISFDANCETTTPDYTSLLVATDNCTDENDLIITQIPTPGTPLAGSIPVTLTVSDASSNTRSCSFQLTITDDTNPTIVCPSQIDVYADASCDAFMTDISEEFSGADNCTDFEDLIFNQSPAIGDNVNSISEVEVFYTDEAGNNSTTCIVPIEIIDTIAPTIVCPGSQNQNIGLDCEYEVPVLSNNAQVTENCSNFTITQEPAIGTIIPTGQTIVTLTATDDTGNFNECIFTLNVIEPVAPTIQCPEDIYTCDEVVTYDDPIVDDNCEVAFWEQVDNTGLTSGDSFPLGITEQTFEVVDNSGNKQACTFSIEVVEPSNLAHIITEDIELCDVASIFLQAELPITGSGEWSVVEGEADFNNELANETGANNLADGENVFVWTVTSADCGISTDTVRVILHRSPIPASTAGNQFVCSDTATVVTIAGNAPSVGEGVWFSIDPNVSITDPNSPATAVNVNSLQPGWNDIVWQITNGTCPATRDTLGIFYGAETTLLSADTTLCLEENELVLDGGEPAEGVQSTWIYIRGGGVFENSTDPVTTTFDIQGGSNLIVFEQRSDFCPIIRDTIEITIELCSPYEPELPTVFTPNGDGRNDLFIVDQLNALYPSSEVRIVNRWGNLVFESVGYPEPWNGKRMNTGEDLPLGTYFYRISLNDGTGQELTGPISIVR